MQLYSVAVAVALALAPASVSGAVSMEQVGVGNCLDANYNAYDYRVDEVQIDDGDGGLARCQQTCVEEGFCLGVLFKNSEGIFWCRLLATDGYFTEPTGTIESGFSGSGEIAYVDNGGSAASLGTCYRATGRTVAPTSSPTTPMPTTSPTTPMPTESPTLSPTLSPTTVVQLDEKYCNTISAKSPCNTDPKCRWTKNACRTTTTSAPTGRPTKAPIGYADYENDVTRCEALTPSGIKECRAQNCRWKGNSRSGECHTVMREMLPPTTSSPSQSPTTAAPSTSPTSKPTSAPTTVEEFCAGVANKSKCNKAAQCNWNNSIKECQVKTARPTAAPTTRCNCDRRLLVDETELGGQSWVSAICSKVADAAFCLGGTSGVCKWQAGVCVPVQE